MKKVEYKSSNKKVMIATMLSLVLLIIFMVGIQVQFIGNLRLILQAASIIFVGITCLVLIKNAKNAFCTNCNTDLFNVISAADMQKIKVNYCPSCGSKIKI